MISVRHLAVRTADLSASRRFYEEGLGLRYLGTRPPSVAINLSDGTINLTLLPYDGPARSAMPEGTEFVHFGFVVEDLSATYRRLIDLGARIVSEDINERGTPSGAEPQSSFKVLDPNGIVLDVAGRPDEWRVG
jgi:catechol 2,3-dioxygenase-like lactoylglutathione lyase family enzyme